MELIVDEPDDAGNVTPLDAARRRRDLDDRYVELLARIFRGAERHSPLAEACWSEYLAARRLG